MQASSTLTAASSIFNTNHVVVSSSRLVEPLWRAELDFVPGLLLKALHRATRVGQILKLGGLQRIFQFCPILFHFRDADNVLLRVVLVVVAEVLLAEQEGMVFFPPAGLVLSGGVIRVDPLGAGSERFLIILNDLNVQVYLVLGLGERGRWIFSSRRGRRWLVGYLVPDLEGRSWVLGLRVDSLNLLAMKENFSDLLTLAPLGLTRARLSL
uniref:Uncharacterized protein n=1 Tax=Strombidium inclinatum TaxID=197538 RepID=A0A7S3N0I3_9SPIT|mmetsp:Transcript_35390/g.54168  ORF Transcript_35390/g.54168 Transcript_35390/m.54168 type:complete len:211 (+) Transcript_35390:199-831(+)